jgi:LCP family protein required for cell wall assembly
MSIPRDFKVDIPGYALPDKINAAFANGGAQLAVKTVKNLLSTPERPFRVNHVIQVDFVGFRDLVDFVGCVYVDIDQDYFNDVGGPGGYATIDVDPGYQKLCGNDALDYVRYRHTTTTSSAARASRTSSARCCASPGCASA